MQFKLVSKFKPAGDQPKAIAQLVDGLGRGDRMQTLLGVTGSGKTFAMANVIQEIQQPTLVIAHNKTLAAQLCQEFREFFPQNAVHYFVSYYDYYQPEAYLPTTDTYIEKESMVNEEIDRLRHAATQSLLTRRDVIIVASVSCIYGLGSPEMYEKGAIRLEVGQPLTRGDLLRNLVEMQYERTNADVGRGQVRVRGDLFEIMPANEDRIYRADLSGQEVQSVEIMDSVTRRTIEKVDRAFIFPRRHYVTFEPEREKAMKSIRQELKERLDYFRKDGKLLEIERLDRRTRFDLEMVKNVGFCHGIENYSRHFDGRAPGEPPFTLMEYFAKATGAVEASLRNRNATGRDLPIPHLFPPPLRKGEETEGGGFLTIIDESHVTIPQLGGMYEGDASRKRTLVEYGFRLPSASDNRPLKFNEFEERVGQVIFTSATPGPYEKTHSAQVVEMVVRPTGLVDPELIVRPVTASVEATQRDRYATRRGNSRLKSRVLASKSQVDDLLERIAERIARKERVLVTTLTKKMAEDLTEFINSEFVNQSHPHPRPLPASRTRQGEGGRQIPSPSSSREEGEGKGEGRLANKPVAVYLHSDVDTLDRIKILTEFRKGTFDVLVGVNLLREGLDLPEVSLVAILDADKEGFLRSETSLIQTIGRAARNVRGQVILYADEITGSMKRAIDETNRRRKIQTDYNEKHHITPQTIKKRIRDFAAEFGLEGTQTAKAREKMVRKIMEVELAGDKGRSLEEIIADKEKQMREAAKALEFELAAVLRDEIKMLKAQKRRSTKLTITNLRDRVKL